MEYENERQRRLFSEVLSGTTDGLDGESVLELLLSMISNTDEAQKTASELCCRFGGISGLLDADAEDISHFCGSDETAVCIKLVRSLLIKYIDEKTNISGECYDNIEKLGRYFVGKFAALDGERVLVLMLDNSFRAISEQILCEGSVNSAKLNVGKLVLAAKEKHASSVVISHNHPRGIALPSSEDIETTSIIHARLEAEGIVLLEHILVAGGDYTPIMYTKLGNRRHTPSMFYGEV